MPKREIEDCQINVLHCENCGTLDPGPRSLCPKCHSAELAEIAVPGAGTLLSWTTIRRPPTAFREEGPYHIAVVDLDAKLRVTARLTAPSPGIAPGARVLCVGTRNDVPVFQEIDA
ncbi:OB-fold domain-containing protein [Marinobacter changyiensis]|uniref:Zn-ribbon domain-containing OB-fold protein n=1 Tax=Marinobacter changyiensis TaxID=2604091 RepID=UPI00126495CD